MLVSVFVCVCVGFVFAPVKNRSYCITLRQLPQIAGLILWDLALDINGECRSIGMLLKYVKTRLFLVCAKFDVFSLQLLLFSQKGQR